MMQWNFDDGQRFGRKFALPNKSVPKKNAACEKNRYNYYYWMEEFGLDLCYT